uniref:Uncharacterized protein n=1 Tax=Arundo donax TaxID=35708 RepID=A0A0A9HA44_ARUDO
MLCGEKDSHSCPIGNFYSNCCFLAFFLLVVRTIGGLKFLVLYS